MKKTFGTLTLLPLLLSLSSCADLVIKDVNMLWTTDARQVQARIKNEGSLSAGAFDVSFEVSGISEQQVGKAAFISTVQQLGGRDSEMVNADFSTIATPENRYLNESRAIKIVVDSEQDVWERNESNNTLTRKLVALDVHLTPPAISPLAINATVQAEVTFSVRVYGRDALLKPQAIAILRVDRGSTTPVAALNDEGRDGDNIAGDNIYAGQTLIKQSSPGLLQFVVSVSYGVPFDDRVSAPGTLQVMPAGTPTVIRPSDMTQVVSVPETREKFLCNEIIVLSKPDVPVETIRTAVQSIQGTVVGLFAGEKLNSWQVEIPCNGVEGVYQAIQSLSNVPGIAGAEPHGIAEGTPVTPNDPAFGQQWGLTQIQAGVAWALSRGLMFNGIPIAIAIVDSGVDYNHQDLSNIWLGQDFVNNDNDPMDDHDHGTHVAGIAGATAYNNIGVTGVAQTVLIAEKVLDATNSGPWGGVASGIQDAVDLGAQVINLSLGGNVQSTAVISAMNYANTRNRLIVAAAGNNNCSDASYPAAFADTTQSQGTNFDTRVIAVGASDANDQHSIWWAGQPQCTANSGSNFGAWVDICAPGTNIRSTTRANNYANWDGTSMAAPHVSGTAALMWARHPTASPNTIREILLSTAENTGNTDPGGNAILRLNAFRAVMEATARNCLVCPQSPEVEINGNQINLGVAGRGRTETQPRSAHGAAIPLLRAIQYQIVFRYNINTWDAYRPFTLNFAWGRTGPREPFTVSFSLNNPYWRQTLSRPLGDTPTIAFLLTWGGAWYGDLLLESVSDQSTVNVVGRSNSVYLDPVDFLNVVVDTRTNDGLPSWGSVEILDITPTYTTQVCRNMMIAGQQFQVCNGP